MAEQPQQWYRKTDEDTRATPEQRKFARKRDAKAVETKAAADAKAAKETAENTLYDEHIQAVKAEEAQRIARNHRLSPGRDH